MMQIHGIIFINVIKRFAGALINSIDIIGTITGTTEPITKNRSLLDAVLFQSMVMNDIVLNC